MRGLLKYRFGQQDSLLLAALVLVAFSFLFGGASRQHELRLALVELSALPVAVLAGRALVRGSTPEHHRFALGLAAAAAALPLIQLVPLPPAVWTALPGRDQLVLMLEVAGLPQGWIPLSLTPDKTWRSFLALLPPLAIFLAVISTRPNSHRLLVYALLGGALLAILLGAAQFLSGTDRLHPWATTDAGQVTGFFANRNHMATLCLVSIPFATVLGARTLRRGASSSRLPFWLSILFIGLVAVALGIIRSRAGIILFGPVFGASLLAAWVAAGRGRPRPLLLGLIGGAAISIAAIGTLAAGPLLERFNTGGATEGRWENWPIVAAAAEAHLPLGTGLGSFDAVFRSVEPLEQLDSTFFNQAHNDYLETWLEAGWLGLALIVAFLVWYGRRNWTAWRSGVSTARDLQRAATIAIGAVLLHSAVDYPLRTATMATIFALCCGLLELAVRTDAELAPERSRRRR